MKNEITIKEINGKKVLKVRIKTPAPKVFKDKKKYNRKEREAE
jgi:hypothetical protein